MATDPPAIEQIRARRAAAEAAAKADSERSQAELDASLESARRYVIETVPLAVQALESNGWAGAGIHEVLRRDRKGELILKPSRRNRRVKVAGRCFALVPSGRIETETRSGRGQLTWSGLYICSDGVIRRGWQRVAMATAYTQKIDPDRRPSRSLSAQEHADTNLLPEPAQEWLRIAPALSDLVASPGIDDWSS